VKQIVIVWGPFVRPVNVIGDVHAKNAPLSSLQVAVQPPPEVENVHVIVLPLPLHWTVGGETTMVQVLQALGPKSPIGVVARTQNVCVPKESPEYDFGLVQFE
jgi:hypothetical protein